LYTENLWIRIIHCLVWLCWEREIQNKNIWWVSSIFLILLLLCLFVLFYWNGTQTQLKELSTLIKHKQMKWIQLIVVNNNLVWIEFVLNLQCVAIQFVVVFVVHCQHVVNKQTELYVQTQNQSIKFFFLIELFQFVFLKFEISKTKYLSLWQFIWSFFFVFVIDKFSEL
jgi:hypothetical protein